MFKVIDSKRGEVEGSLTYEEACMVLHEECERYVDDGWTVEQDEASEHARLTTSEAGIDYVRFLSVERDEVES